MKKLKKLANAVLISAFSGVAVVNASASSIQQSKAFTGTLKLINDVTNALLVISPIITILLIIYYIIRTQMSSEMNDEVTYKKKMKTAGMLGAAVFAVAGLVNIIIGYYK